MQTPRKSAQASNFIIDPARDGVSNALWKAATGSPALAGSTPDAFRFNADDALVRADVLYGIFEFSVKFPLTGSQTPTNLVNNISFGLKNLSLATKAKIEVLASKSGNSFALRTYDEFGTLETTTITWDTAWNGVATVFRFGWSESHVSLDVLVGGGTSWSNLANHTTRVPSRPLNPFVTVVGAENLDVDFISARNTQSSSVMLI